MTAEVIAASVAIAFVLFGAGCTALVVVGIPGAWIVLAAAIAIDCLDWLWLPSGSPLTFHPLTLAAAALVAGLGELLEFLGGAAGARRFGASARGVLGALVGGLIGAIAGTLLVPILVVGTLVGALAGTAAGAIAGELLGGKRSLQETLRPATGAVVGRVVGTLLKLPMAAAVLVILSVAAFA
ncbi:MAG: DUF456 domain-containing protein [Planctomycetaceae bacterium]|nr:DUF456 domain-containing protein [Planctomycetaceae bacterium]